MEQVHRACVKCTAVLSRSTFGGVEVDLCDSCGGLWLDRGELEKLGETGGLEVEKLKDTLTGSGTAAEASDTQSSCPACPGTLKTVMLGPIQIDFCTQCQGLFLDKGELEQALALGATAEQVLLTASKAAQDAQAK